MGSREKDAFRSRRVPTASATGRWLSIERRDRTLAPCGDKLFNGR